MRKATELIGKELVNQATGEKLATIQDVILDKNAHHVLAVLIDSGGWFRDAKVVHWRNVASVGDVVVVRGETAPIIASEDPQIALLMEEKTTMTGTTIISGDGERIGTVSDLYIADDGRVVGFEVSQGFLSDFGGRKFLASEHVTAVGKDAIIASPADLVPVKEVLHEQGEGSPDHQPVIHAEPIVEEQFAAEDRYVMHAEPIVEEQPVAEGLSPVAPTSSLEDQVVVYDRPEDEQSVVDDDRIVGDRPDMDDPRVR